MKVPGWGCRWVTCQRPRGPAVTTSSVGGRLPLWALEGHTPSVGQVIPHSLDGEGRLPAPQEARPGCPPPSWPRRSAPLPPSTRTSVTWPRVARTLPHTPHDTHASATQLTHSHCTQKLTALTWCHTHHSLSLTHSQGVSHPPTHLSHTRLSHRLSRPQNCPMVPPSHLTHILPARPQSHTQLSHDLYSWSHTHLTHTPLSDTISCVYAQLAHGHTHFSHIRSHTHSHRPPTLSVRGLDPTHLFKLPRALAFSPCDEIPTLSQVPAVSL